MEILTPVTTGDRTILWSLCEATQMIAEGLIGERLDFYWEEDGSIRPVFRPMVSVRHLDRERTDPPEASHDKRLVAHEMPDGIQ